MTLGTAVANLGRKELRRQRLDYLVITLGTK